MSAVMQSGVVRGLRRAFLCVLAVLAAAAVAMLAINWRDETLLPDARDMLAGNDLEPVAPEQNLFFDLIGLGSAEGDNPNAEGRRIFALFQQARLHPGGAADSADFLEATHTRALPRLETSVDLCPFVAEQPPYRCIADAAAKRSVWQALLAENSALLERAGHFPAEPRYLNPLPEDFRLPWPNWAFAAYAKRLLLSSWALRVERGDKDEVVRLVSSDTDSWRALLAGKNLRLLDKMVAVAHIRVDFLFISELMRTSGLTAGQYDVLAGALRPVSLRERSLKGVFASELRFSANEIYGDSRDHRFKGTSPGSQLRYVVTHALMLPNATVNRMFRNYQRMSWVSEQSCDAFDRNIAESKQQMRLSLTDHFYNATGNEVAALSPEYSSYIIRMCDLQGMQRLVALQLRIARGAVADAAIPAVVRDGGADYADPYTGQAMQWDEQRHALSFGARDQRDRRLLPWPI